MKGGKEGLGTVIIFLLVENTSLKKDEDQAKSFP
jgi:hypothetical protein